MFSIIGLYSPTWYGMTSSANRYCSKYARADIIIYILIGKLFLLL